MRTYFLFYIILIFSCISIFSADSTTVRPLPFKAGDAVQITVYPDTNSFPSGIYPIDGEGYIDLPVLGYLQITSMTSAKLEDTLKTTFAELLHYPNIKARPLLRVAFVGGFQRPGLYFINPHSSLWQTIQLAGSTTRSDGLKKILWERDKIAVSTNLLPIIQSGKSLYQIGFRSGDQLRVAFRPERSGWEVFRVEVLPMITFSLSTVLTAASVYQTYLLYKDHGFGH